MYRTLEKSVGSRLVRPDDKRYEEARKVWNEAIDRKPAAIVVCEAEQDVQAAVRFAKEHGLEVSVRGGGHHVAGLAVCDGGVMVDLSRMNRVTVDEGSRIATVGGGAKLADVDRETQKYGLATPTGTVSETGIAGLALSGGLGYLRGKYGLTCDNIRGARIVTAEGDVLQVDEQNHNDLFWAIRGGGGNFGIVTEFKFALHPVGPDVLALDVMYDFSNAREIFKKAEQYINQAPDEVSFNLTAAQLPPAPFLPEFLHNRKVIMVSGMYAGDPDAGEQVIQPLRELTEPIVDQTGVRPYVQLQSQLDVMVPDRVPVYGTSLYFSELTDEVIDRLLEEADRAPAPSVMVQLWGMSGQMNRVPEDATPFAIRGAKFALLVDAMAMGVSVEACKEWTEALYENLLPYSYKEASYLNGVGLRDTVTKNAYLGNMERLTAVKTKYDPENRFCHNHNIRPAK